MPKGGSVIFKQFRHMKNLPLPESSYFKNYPPPFMWQAQNVTPPTPTPLPSGRIMLPLQGHLWSYSMEALNKESEFATLHVMFQCPWITLHKFLSGDENADQLRLDQETVSALLKSMDTEYDRSILRAIIALLHTRSDPTLARRKIKEVIEVA